MDLENEILDENLDVKEDVKEEVKVEVKEPEKKITKSKKTYSEKVDEREEKSRIEILEEQVKEMKNKERTTNLKLILNDYGLEADEFDFIKDELIGYIENNKEFEIKVESFTKFLNKFIDKYNSKTSTEVEKTKKETKEETKKDILGNAFTPNNNKNNEKTEDVSFKRYKEMTQVQRIEFSFKNFELAKEFNERISSK